jgi:hypothetical protein
MKSFLAFVSLTLVAGFTSIACAEGGTGDVAFPTLSGSYGILNPKVSEPMCKLDGQLCESSEECCTNICMLGICGNGGH